MRTAAIELALHDGQPNECLAPADQGALRVDPVLLAFGQDGDFDHAAMLER